MTNTVYLHIANKNYSSWSLRAWVLMRQLALPFDEVLTPFSDQPGAFRRFSPSGKVPCLIDGETTVWDTLAIAEYLAETHPQVWPAAHKARAWARCAAAEMHSGFFGLRSGCPMNCGLRVRIDALPEAVKNDLVRLDELWNDGLTRFAGPFLAGADFTAVDAFFAPVAFRMQTYALSLSAPAQTYAERLLALPAMRAWYDAALDETWRDANQDAEALRAGTCLQDLRQSKK